MTSGEETKHTRRTFLGLTGAAVAGGVVASQVLPAPPALADPPEISILGYGAETLIVENQVGERQADQWKTAIAKAVASPGTYQRILGSAATYAFPGTIDISGLSNITIAGMGIGQTTFSSNGTDGTLTALFGNPLATAPIVGVVFENFSVYGGMQPLTDTQSATRLRDERTWPASNNGALATAIKLTGSFGLTTGTQVQDITIRHVSMYGTKELPVILRRVRGTATITDCRFERCKDVGFTYNQSVAFTNNFVRYSADNGVSISRGNEASTCQYNTIVQSYYGGIMAGGNVATAERGPKNVMIQDNTVDGAGSYGVDLTLAPQNVTVTNNSIHDAKIGVAVCGWVLDTPDTYVAGGITYTRNPSENIAKSITITDNVIADSKRGGATVYFADTVLIERNAFFFSQATDALGTSPHGGVHMYGVSNQGTSDSVQNTSTNVTVQTNQIIETAPRRTVYSTASHSRTLERIGVLRETQSSDKSCGRPTRRRPNDRPWAGVECVTPSGSRRQSLNAH